MEKEITVIKNDYAEISFKDGIIFGVFHPDINVDIVGARKVVEDRKRASGFEQAPLLVDVTRINSLTKEARSYLSSEEGSQLLTASAILVDSGFTSMVANFFLRVNLKKPIIPVRMFSEIKEAIKWLEQYK